MRGMFLDPKADLTFKKIFGEHPHLVISLLNALLPLKNDEHVESIEYWPPEKIPERTEVEKYSIVDVCCRDNKKREFLVEMQMSWTESFKKRVLLNASKAYVAQSWKGSDYESLQPVYALNFVNEEFQKDVDDYYHYYHFVHDKYTNKVIDGLHLIFVELPKFKPQTFSEKRMQVLWLRFLTEINETTREVPAELLESEEVKEALEIVEVAAFSDAEMRAYDKFWDRISVQRTLENALKREAEKAKAETEQAKAEIKQAKAETEQAKVEIKQAKAETEQAKVEIKQAKAETEQAKVEIKQAKAETEQAKVEIKQAKAETEQAKERLVQVVRNLKALSMTTAQIAAVTGLTAEEIKTL